MLFEFHDALSRAVIAVVVAASGPEGVESEGQLESRRPTMVRHSRAPTESVEQIALRYGARESRVRELNGLGEDDELTRRHKTVKVWATRTPPPREKMSYVVEADDTWASIGRAHGLAPSEVRRPNVGRLGRKLAPGMELTLWVDPIVFEGIRDDESPAGAGAEVAPGAHSVGTPQDGYLVNAVRIPDSELWEFRFPGSAYGTTHAVRSLVAILEAFRAESDFAGDIRIGAMSRPGGKELGGHVSHQTGRDVDVRLPTRIEVPQALPPIPRRVDWLALWDLLRIAAASDAVAVIFLDYQMQKRVHRAATGAGVDPDLLREVLQFPRGRAASRGVVRHEPGHEGHIHIRFRCGRFEPECAD